MLDIDHSHARLFIIFLIVEQDGFFKFREDSRALMPVMIIVAEEARIENSFEFALDEEVVRKKFVSLLEI